LRGGGWQTQYAQSYSEFDCGGIGTTIAEEEWGVSMPHQDTITPFEIKDWTWILNRVKNWSYNWVFGAHGGLVMLIIPEYVVRDRGMVKGATDTDNVVRVETSYGIIDAALAVRLNDGSLASWDYYHINNPCITSSGEIEATILQLFSWDTQTCDELLLCDGAQCIDDDGYNNVFASSRAGSTLHYDHWQDTAMRIDEDRRAHNRGENDYGEKDGNGIMRYGVYIALKRKFDRIANTMSVETSLDRAMLDDDMPRGYQEGISGEGITLVDGEHVRNINRDDSNNIPMYGYRSMGGSMGYTYFDESSVISNEGNNECIGSDDMTNINAVGSSINQDTDDNVSTTMRDDNAYTHTGDKIHDTRSDYEEREIGQGNNIRIIGCNKGCSRMDLTANDGDKSTTDVSRGTNGNKITSTGNWC
jgi:hypothetical protein